MFFIVGLGNPGAEYENTRHNTGRFVLDYFRKANEFPDWEYDKKLNTLVSKNFISSSSTVNGKKLIVLLAPQTFMNKSGESLKQIKDLKISAKEREVSNLIVMHDDLDIPFGKFKISFNKSSGGHKGVESVIHALKTQAFVRIRVGISPTTRKGIVKKPRGEDAVQKYILGKFSADELAALKKLAKRLSEALFVLVTEGKEKAMSRYN